MSDQREKQASTEQPNEMGQSNAIGDLLYEGRDDQFMDIDRMINEGLGGGNVTRDNGLIEETSTDTMDEPDSILQEEN